MGKLLFYILLFISCNLVTFTRFMNRITPLLVLVCSFWLAFQSCSRKPVFEKMADGVIVHLPKGGSVQLVSLNVISDKIIQVRATASGKFSEAQSLMRVPYTGAAPTWELEETAEMLTIKTPFVNASVMLSTGEVKFSDADGNVLLQEKIGGGKSIVPNSEAGDYRIQHEFESPEDEAFYGLGGHQNGQMNYKGDDVEMAQHNIVAVVPFLYSSRNYGLLWDNYSITRFGDPSEYEPLSTLTLFDREGNEGGLTVDYYVGEVIKTSRIENEINFEFLETPQVDSFPADVSRNGKVIWEGFFSSPREGRHKFLSYSSGYIKIWIDDHLVLDKWRQNWNPWTNKFTINCRGDEKHKIRIEWIPDDHGYFAFKHLDPYPEDAQERLTLSSEVGEEINYYFIAGANADEVISGYRTLTGKAPILPKWAVGFWQSRERYRNQKDLLDVVKEYRKRGVPLDNIVLDWQYWEDPKWGSHEFDLSRFPDAKGMVDELHNQLNAHIMISVWPKFNLGTDHYNEMNEKGYLFTRNIEKGRKDWVGIGYQSTFYDPFNEGAGTLFWQQIDEHLNSLGIDGWWLDATEPDMHSNLSIDERKLNMSPTAMGSGAKYFNAYSLVNSKSVYEGQRQSTPGKRVFILTRSAYAGQQRYGAVTWSGDIVSRWSDFKDQISSGVNFSLSGIPYWTMDIGGFSVERKYNNAAGEVLDEWRELNTRWFQFGAFCPLFRSHGQYPFREIYNLAETGSVPYNSMVYYDKLRYKLLPYIYSLTAHCYLSDYTLMRGLVMDFGHDRNVLAISDQYMLGPSLLINPVYTYKARERSVYLPAGTGWYDLYTGRYYQGGTSVIASAPLDRMPVFVKQGSILPMGPELQYSSEKPADALQLYVYCGADADFVYYEDEGTNYDYEKGEYITIPINYIESEKVLRIGAQVGRYQGMPAKRTINIIWIDSDNPGGVPSESLTFDGSEVIIRRR